MKIIKFFLTIILLGTPIFSFAQLEISEIMYDVPGSDTGREWIEVHNTGGAEINISNWKFLESPSASNHSLTLVQGTASLAGNGLAVIVSDSTRFLIDWPGFSGTIFKASFSMNNTGSTLILKDGELNVKDEVNYSSTQGANGDGNTLQKSGTSWVAGTPTPGATNTSAGNSTSATTTVTSSESRAQSSSSGNSSSSSSGSTHSSPVPLGETKPKITFEVSAGRDRLTTVGNSITFQSEIIKSDNISPESIFYTWSFGDGLILQGKTVTHHYNFPGEHVVVLNAQSSDLQAVSRVNVRVFTPQISILRVSDGVELTNKTANEINLEGWSLVSSNKSFMFPKDTIISGNKKVVFPDNITGLFGDKWEILNPVRQLLASYENKPPEIPVVISVSTTTQNEIGLLQIKLEEAKRELAKMTATSQIITPQIVAGPTIETAELVLPENNSSNSNVASVFVAERTPGTIGRIFSWPIKGVNWVTRLFVDE